MNKQDFDRKRLEQSLRGKDYDLRLFDIIELFAFGVTPHLDS
jgi:hypothetical protein